MLLAHPDAAQSVGGQTRSPEIADARQEQPGFPALRAGQRRKACRAVGPPRHCGSASIAATGPADAIDGTTTNHADAGLVLSVAEHRGDAPPAATDSRGEPAAVAVDLGSGQARLWAVGDGIRVVADEVDGLRHLNLSDPIGSIGVLADYVGQRLLRRVRPDRLEGAHPALARHADRAAEEVGQLRATPRSCCASTATTSSPGSVSRNGSPTLCCGIGDGLFSRRG